LQRNRSEWEQYGNTVSDTDKKLSTRRAPASTRRQMLVFGAVAGAAALTWYAWPSIRRLVPHDFAFEDLKWPAGFRKIAGGQVTLGADALVGINRPSVAAARNANEAAEANPCISLFGSEPLRSGIVPIASFSDYNCPYCRVLSNILIELEEASHGRVRITWHEWPILGQSSRIMARAALAARRQGGYLRFHHTLMRTRFLPDSVYLKDLAERKGLNPELLRADMQSPEIAWDITRSSTLAELMGLSGVPALVVGRTAISGAISRAQLEDLIDIERESGPIPGCA
jgi:predicted DsbA family dithiol-disulfide isomerase